MKTLLLLLFFPLIAQAQVPNTTPQALSGLNGLMEVDIRLRGPATPTGTFPTIKLIPGVKFDQCLPIGANCWLADFYYFNWKCDNTASNCREVTNVTVQAFIRTPLGRLNVTRFTGFCGWSATTCVLPPFASISAPPGQFYTFKYDRIKAEWALPPAISPVLLEHVAPPPVQTTTGIFSTINDGAILNGVLVWVAAPMRTPQRVEFYVDGVMSPAVEFASPYQFNGDPNGILNTTTMTNGPHELKIIAFYPDATSETRIIKVTVAN